MSEFASPRQTKIRQWRLSALGRVAAERLARFLGSKFGNVSCNPTAKQVKKHFRHVLLKKICRSLPRKRPMLLSELRKAAQPVRQKKLLAAVVSERTKRECKARGNCRRHGSFSDATSQLLRCYTDVNRALIMHAAFSSYWLLRQLSTSVVEPEALRNDHVRSRSAVCGTFRGGLMRLPVSRSDYNCSGCLRSGWVLTTKATH